MATRQQRAAAFALHAETTLATKKTAYKQAALAFVADPAQASTLVAAFDSFNTHVAWIATEMKHFNNDDGTDMQAPPVDE